MMNIWPLLILRQRSNTAPITHFNAQRKPKCRWYQNRPLESPAKVIL